MLSYHTILNCGKISFLLPYRGITSILLEEIIELILADVKWIFSTLV